MQYRTQESAFRPCWTCTSSRWVLITLLLVAGFLLSGAGACFAQNTNSGDIRGIVTDPTGAVVPGVTVTAKDVEKNVTTVYTTNAAGLYDTGPIVPDRYVLTFTKDGFKQYVRGPVTINVGSETVNAQLAVGATTQRVVVTTQLPLLNTESGALETTLEAKTMAQLPQTGTPDWEQFINLQPGAATLPGDELQSAATNGNLPYDSILADGATTTLPQSQNSDVTIFETTAEVKMSDTAFSAQYGVGDIIYNQITKSGTDHFHGAAYEYLQNNALNAASYGFGTQVTVPTIHYDNFGVAIGGPVEPLKKLFFYFDFDKIIDNGAANNGFITVPTAAEEGGDFTAPGLPTLYDPTHQTLVTTGNCTYAGSQYPGGSLIVPAPCVERPSFASEYGNGNRIPSSMISPAAQAIQKYFPAANVPGTVGADGVVTNNYAYTAPNQNPSTRFFGRLDWDVTPSNRLTISETEGDNPAVNLGQGLCPINCYNADVSHDNAQISDTWTIGSKAVNEARIGFTDQLNFFTSQAQGQGWASKLDIPSLVYDMFPSVNLSNFYGLGNGTNAIYKEMLFDPSDVFMLVRGRHILHFGGEFLINRADSTAWGNVNPGSFSFNGDYTSEGGGPTGAYDGLDYADFLLGQTDGWSAGISPEYGGRWKAPQLFIQDDWKVRKSLTLNMGVRWEGETGWSEVKGNEAAFDPAVVSMDVTDPVGQGYGQVVQGGMWYDLLGQNGRHSLQQPKYDIVLPRLGFSWGIFNNTVVKGGIGMYAATWSEDTYGGGLGDAFSSSGSDVDVTDGTCPVDQLSSSGMAPDTADPGCGAGNNNGWSLMSTYLAAPTTPWAHQGLSQSVTYNKYRTPVPTNYQWTLGVQRQFAGNFAAEVDYVGNRGTNLVYNVDIDQVPEGKLGPNDQQYEPYPLYGAIDGSTDNGISNYNALEAILTKRMSYGLSFSTNYTWSHFLDDQDSSGWGGQQGNQDWQNATTPSSNYGNSNFDIRQMFKGEAIYQLPFGKGRLFLNRSRLADEAIGGWQISGTWVAQAGNPFEITSYKDTSNSFGNNNFVQFPNLTSNYKTTDPNTGNHYHSLQEWFNASAFSIPATYTFGTFGRNQVVGPGLSEVNFSLGKTFDLWPERNVLFQLRGDATNVLNHPSFAAPGSTGVGSIQAPLPAITGTTIGGRVIQIYGRLSF